MDELRVVVASEIVSDIDIPHLLKNSPTLNPDLKVTPGGHIYFREYIWSPMELRRQQRER